MKVPLQLVVVLNAQRNFHDILLKFTLHVRVNLTKLTTTTTNCRVSFIDLYLVFLENLRIVFSPYKHCNFTGTVVVISQRAWVTCSHTCFLLTTDHEVIKLWW